MSGSSSLIVLTASRVAFDRRFELEENDVGLESPYEAKTRLGVVRLADHADAVRVETAFDVESGAPVAVDDDESQRALCHSTMPFPSLLYSINTIPFTSEFPRP